MPRPLTDTDGATIVLSFENRKKAEEWVEHQGGINENCEIRDFGVDADGTPPHGWSKVEGGASIWRKQ